MAALLILAIGILIVVNGLLAMCEMAIVSASRGRLEQMAEEGNRGARVALTLAADPGRFLSAVQTGVTMIGIVNGVLSGATLADWLGEHLAAVAALQPYAAPAAVVILVAAVTYLTIVIGELVPKQLALKHPEGIAAWVARPLLLFSRAIGPLVWLLTASSGGVLRLFGVRAGYERRVTDEDIHALIMQAEKSGGLRAVEREMVEGVLDLEDTSISTIMTPRPSVVWVDLEDPRDRVLAEIRACPHGQVLVSRGSIDEMVGIVRKQDLLDQTLDGKAPDVERAIVTPLVIPEGVSILKALEQFRMVPINTAVIVDEYGTIQGLVTRTDLLQALAGDLAEAGNDGSVVRRNDGSLLVDAATPIAEVFELLEIEQEPEGDYVTLAGFVLDHLGHLPRAGEQFMWEGWRFRVVKVEGHRIDRVLLAPVGKPPEKDRSG